MLRRIAVLGQVPFQSIARRSLATWTPTPDPGVFELGNISRETQVEVIIRTGTIGTLGFAGAFFLTFDTVAESFLFPSLFGVAAGALAGMVRLNESPEFEMLHTTVQYRKLEDEFRQLESDPCCLVAVNYPWTNIDQRVNHPGPEPLIAVYTHWMQTERKLRNLQTEAETILKQRETHLKVVEPAFQYPLGSGLILAMQSMQKDLSAAMIRHSDE